MKRGIRVWPSRSDAAEVAQGSGQVGPASTKAGDTFGTSEKRSRLKRETNAEADGC